VKRSNLAFSEEIATHPSGARNDRRNRYMPSLSLDLGNKYMACITSIDDITSFEISDTDKKEYPDASYYFDRKPRKIKLKNVGGSIRNIRFTADSGSIILTNGGGKYKYDMKENELSEIKELPPGVTIKNFPEEIELKSDDKHKAKVFDIHCDK
jgi:hypothetical protein